MQREDCVTIMAPGTTVTTAAGTASVALPNTLAGTVPRYVRIASTGESYVRIGTSTVVATTNDVLVQPADAVTRLSVGGATHIAYIQGTAAAKVNIVPLEDS